ncbi:hypothetical protein M8J76_003677 [Diaphorina citri]|nr:hypothetical protein M8J76_003677 [Diaphorina citri]
MCWGDCFLCCLSLQSGAALVSTFGLTAGVLGFLLVPFVPFSAANENFSRIMFYMFLLAFSHGLALLGTMIESRKTLGFGIVLVFLAFLLWTFLTIPSFLEAPGVSGSYCFGLRCGESHWMVPRTWSTLEPLDEEMIFDLLSGANMEQKSSRMDGQFKANFNKTDPLAALLPSTEELGTTAKDVNPFLDEDKATVPPDTSTKLPDTYKNKPIRFLSKHKDQMQELEQLLNEFAMFISSTQADDATPTPTSQTTLGEQPNEVLKKYMVNRMRKNLNGVVETSGEAKKNKVRRSCKKRKRNALAGDGNVENSSVDDNTFQQDKTSEKSTADNNFGQAVMNLNSEKSGADNKYLKETMLNENSEQMAVDVNNSQQEMMDRNSERSTVDDNHSKNSLTNREEIIFQDKQGIFIPQSNLKQASKNSRYPAFMAKTNWKYAWRNSRNPSLKDQLIGLIRQMLTSSQTKRKSSSVEQLIENRLISNVSIEETGENFETPVTENAKSAVYVEAKLIRNPKDGFNIPKLDTNSETSAGIFKTRLLTNPGVPEKILTNSEASTRFLTNPEASVRIPTNPKDPVKRETISHNLEAKGPSVILHETKSSIRKRRNAINVVPVPMFVNVRTLAGTTNNAFINLVSDVSKFLGLLYACMFLCDVALLLLYWATMYCGKTPENDESDEELGVPCCCAQREGQPCCCAQRERFERDKEQPCCCAQRERFERDKEQPCCCAQGEV